jgi:hypothetical protein
VITRYSGFSVLMSTWRSSSSASSSSRCVPAGSSRKRASSATPRSRSVANRSAAVCLTIANPPLRCSALRDGLNAPAYAMSSEVTASIRPGSTRRQTCSFSAARRSGRRRRARESKELPERRLPRMPSRQTLPRFRVCQGRALHPHSAPSLPRQTEPVAAAPYFDRRTEHSSVHHRAIARASLFSSSLTCARSAKSQVFFSRS